MTDRQKNTSLDGLIKPNLDSQKPSSSGTAAAEDKPSVDTAQQKRDARKAKRKERNSKKKIRNKKNRKLDSINLDQN